jgi:hypothetical protein
MSEIDRENTGWPGAVRPRIGFLFLAGESWWEAGLSDAREGPCVGFLRAVERDVEEARRVPLVMWAYDPYRGFPEYFKIEVWLRASGPVSVQQSSNIFKRFGWDYEVVFGNEKEEETLMEIGAFIRAAVVKESLDGTRIAVLPGPCRVVISSWVDEFYLLERFGVELDYVSVEAFGGMVKGIKDKDALGYVNHLKKSYPVDGVDDATLLESARQSLAFVMLIEDRGLSGIALEDFHPDIYRVLGFRPTSPTRGSASSAAPSGSRRTFRGCSPRSSPGGSRAAAGCSTSSSPWTAARTPFSWGTRATGR